jgi:hypothetical protein
LIPRADLFALLHTDTNATLLTMSDTDPKIEDDAMAAEAEGNDEVRSPYPYTRASHVSSPLTPRAG